MTKVDHIKIMSQEWVRTMGAPSFVYQSVLSKAKRTHLTVQDICADIQNKLARDPSQCKVLDFHIYKPKT